jgi:hypothetical protein
LHSVDAGRYAGRDHRETEAKDGEHDKKLDQRETEQACLAAPRAIPN